MLSIRTPKKSLRPDLILAVIGYCLFPHLGAVWNAGGRGLHCARARKHQPWRAAHGPSAGHRQGHQGDCAARSYRETLYHMCGMRQTEGKCYLIFIEWIRMSHVSS